MNPQFFSSAILDKVFDSAYFGTIIVDDNGRIQYISQNYCGFLQMERNKIIGEYVPNIIENTRMHLVVQTGKPEIADLQLLNGYYVIANRIPIFEDKKIIGAIGTIIFRDLNDWKQMNAHIKEILSSHHFYKEEHHVNGTKYDLNDLIGVSNEIQKLRERIKRISTGSISVLIRGESGTGKELVAHSIHKYSERSHKPFVKVNCGAIPEQLLESELFGYEDGAFTGAKKGGKLGKFQLANGGTIFLDEIGDMPLHMQVKLLRVLQENEIEPVGSLYPQKIDVRLIAATNHSLEKLIEEKKFRKDLFYRINSVQLFIPPLRERRRDLHLLVDHFLKKISAKVGKRVVTVSPETISIIEQYDWPGNIRELENVIHASIHLCDDDKIGQEDLPDYLLKSSLAIKEKKTLKDIVEEAERNTIKEALVQYHFDKNKAAKVLGIGHSTLYDKIKKYKLSEER
jgi:transcriptional regulator with PAS, ATPase and Fis domain